MTERAAINVSGVEAGIVKPDIRVGLIGHGIQMSRTPRMHMDEGQTLGFAYRYDLFDTNRMEGDPKVSDLLTQAEGAGYAGVNVTHPFKQIVVAHLDVLSDAARAVKAVNTVVFRDGLRFGHNTDYWGFAEALRRNLSDVKCDRVLLIGAGGAGGAVANALLDHGVGHLVVIDKNPKAATELVDSLVGRLGVERASVGVQLLDELALADGVVNATPVGMASLPGSPVPLDQLQPRQWVADIIYFPLETELLAGARARGCRTMDGSAMAVFQAVRAFELFTGRKPDPNRMRATFDAFTPTAAGTSGN